MSQFEDIDISGKSRQYTSVMVSEPVPVSSSPSSSRAKKLLLVFLAAAATIIMVIVLSSSHVDNTVSPVNNDVVSVSDVVSDDGSGQICSVDGNVGECRDYTTCSGTSTAGLCSGGFNIQCCVPSVAAGDSACTGRGGVCKTSGCSGSWVTGLCAGAADRRCCVSGGGGGGCPSGTVVLLIIISIIRIFLRIISNTITTTTTTNNNNNNNNNNGIVFSLCSSEFVIFCRNFDLIFRWL
jgi:hypothetical protein